MRFRYGRSNRFVLALAVLVSGACRSAAVAQSAAAAPDSMSIRRDIEFLASERLAGRLTGTPGNDSAAAYLARRYKALGLRALSPNYLQKFVARPVAHDGQSPSLPSQNVFALLRGRDPALRNEYIVI